MKFGRVITDLVQMNRRRFIISLYRYIPFAGEFRAHVSLDLVQGFFRWRFVESDRDAVLVDVQPHLLHVRMRFNQPDHARPRAGARLCWLHAWNALVLHLLIIAKLSRLPVLRTTTMFAFSPLAQLRVLQAAGENPDIRCHHRHNAKYN